MEYQKIANSLDIASNKLSKFRTRNWVEINDNIRGAYSPNKQIRFKTAMLRSSLCDYSDAYILVKGNISVYSTAAAGAAANNINKENIFKNYAPFTNCIGKINNIQIDNAEYIDIVTCITQQNIVIIIKKRPEAYGNIVKKYQLQMIQVILLILMELLLLIHLILKQK